MRTRIVAPEQLAAFRWSSLGRFVRGPRRPAMESASWLGTLGLSDTSADWRAYLERLRRLATDEAEQERQGFATRSHGWSIGTNAWRKAVARDPAHNCRREIRCAIRRMEDQPGGPSPTRQGGATIAWLAEALHLGSPNPARVYLSQAKRQRA